MVCVCVRGESPLAGYESMWAVLQCVLPLFWNDVGASVGGNGMCGWWWGCMCAAPSIKRNGCLAEAGPPFAGLRFLSRLHDLAAPGLGISKH